MSDPILRQVTRQKIQAILQAEVAGSGNPAQVVFGGTTADAEGTFPAIILQSFSSGDRAKWQMACWEVDFLYKIMVFVPYASRSDSWTPLNANDKLDELEDRIARCFKKHRVETNYWQDIRYKRATEVNEVAMGGNSYLMEETLVGVVVRGDSSNDEENA